MDTTTYSGLGIAGVLLFILFYVVKYFVAAITKKDEQMMKIVMDFNVTITNHMAHETTAFNELSKVVNLHIHLLQTATKLLAKEKRETKERRKKR